MSVDTLVAARRSGWRSVLVALAYVRCRCSWSPPLLLAGACWLTVLSSLNTSMQRAAPGWVRARTLATFQLVMQAGLAGGSIVWGVLADAAGTDAALLVAGVGLATGIAARVAGGWRPGGRRPLPRARLDRAGAGDRPLARRTAPCS